VYDLKDIRYNEYWGWQDGEKRNSRVKRVEEPILMLNHYWNISDKTMLNTNVAYQFGEIGNSRLDFNGVNRVEDGEGNIAYEGGVSNPSPAYYQLLPSYFERNFPDNPEFAYGAQQQFENDGQINWDRMYTANITNAQNGLNATYALYEDRVDDKQFTANTILTSTLTDNITLNAGVTYKNLKSENFAEITDLLGGIGYLNVDGFEGVPFDEENADYVAGVGDKFRYNFNIYATDLDAYATALFKYSKVDFYVSGNFGSTQYQREGLYRNGLFDDNSFGKGEKLTFTGMGAKAGLT